MGGAGIHSGGCPLSSHRHAGSSHAPPPSRASPCHPQHEISGAWWRREEHAATRDCSIPDCGCLYLGRPACGPQGDLPSGFAEPMRSCCGWVPHGSRSRGHTASGCGGGSE
jgi:hypothetical protein